MELHPIVVLGGYGRIGRLCASELVSRTRAHIRVSGRNAQRAESLALSFGERASARYADATDPRVLARALEGACAVVVCCGGDAAAALQTAIELRVPCVSVSPQPLSPRSREHFGELAWKAQVPVVLHAGAVPGLPGLLAESLVRRLDRIARLEIASTGPFTASETAQRDQAAARVRAGGRWPALWRFAEPVGRRALGESSSAELEGFTDHHLVDELHYLEPPDRALGRLLARVVTPSPGPGFAVAARAFASAGDATPAAEIEVTAADALVPAAALAAAVTAAILEGQVPAGLSSAREVLPPAVALGELEKRGVRVRLGLGNGAQ
jgi:putative NAD(P)-binding protein